MKKIAVDTNVLVRLLATIDSDQSRIAMTLADTHTIYISLTVILETERILRSVIKADRMEINDRFAELLEMDTIEVEQTRVVSSALRLHSLGMDFADALHVSVLDSGDQFLTFDRDLVKLAKRHINTISVELAQ